jgi:hypothetical protein
MGERGERFFYLRGNGIPDNLTPQEKLVRMLSAQYPPEESVIAEAQYSATQLRELLNGKDQNI